jgi:hypothetical protein
VGGELRETNPCLSFVVWLTCLISTIFILLPLDLLGCACLSMQGDHYPLCDHLLKPLKNYGLC